MKNTRIPNTRSYSPIPLHEPTEITSKRRSYRDIWKRAVKKIKLGKSLQRFSEVHTDTPYTASENVLENFCENSRLKSSTTVKSLLPFGLLVPYSNIWIIWTIINLLSLIYISTYGMFYTSFFYYSSQSLEAKTELLIEIIFILDACIHFNLAYFDEDNKLILDRKKIFTRYLKFRFFFDFFTAFPFGILLYSAKSSEFSSNYLFRHIPKLLRWVVIRAKLENFHFIKKFDQFTVKYKPIYEFLTVTFFVLLGIHITACLFFLAAKYNQFSDETWVMRNELNDFSTFNKYLTSLYWSFMTLSGIGYGDIHPYTTLEKQIALCWMVVGIFFWSFTSSRFTITFERIANADALIRENLIFVDDFAQVTKIKSSIKRQFKICIKSKRIITKNLTVDKIVDKHDMNLRYEVAMDIYNKALTRAPFFYRKSEAFVAHFAFHLIYIQYHKDELIWVKGSFSDGIFFIVEGRVSLYHEGILFLVVNEGDYIGDVEVFLKAERKFELKSGDISRCMKMTKNSLKSLKENYPLYYKELKDAFDERMGKMMESIAMMYSLKLYYSKAIASFNDFILQDVKKRMYYKLFADNFLAMRNKKISELIHGAKSVTAAKQRLKNLLRMSLNKHKIPNDIRSRSLL